MGNLASHLSARETIQSDPIPGRDMIENDAGGFVFEIDDFSRLNRFLILGSDGGTYYAGEKDLTIANAACVVRCLEVDARRTIDAVVAISDAGRAAKNTPAVLALAIAMTSKDDSIKAMAIEAVPKVCRIGTHVLQFAQFCKELRGFGAAMRRAVGRWYLGRPVDDLAYQVSKYQSRDGWSHRDVLRLAHVVTEDPARQAVLRWATAGAATGEREFTRTRNGVASRVAYGETGELPAILHAVEEAKTADAARVVQLIRDANLPRECIPTRHLNDVEVWDALLQKMPLTALTRNLAKMTAVGLVKPLSDALKLIREKLADQDYIKKSRLHPLAILTALKAYSSGHGLKGSLSWEPVQAVVDSLDAAFYLAFANVAPANKRTLIALDVSGSMAGADWTGYDAFANIAGSPLSPREAGAAFAMVVAKTEPDHFIMAFGDQFVPLDVSGCSRLSDVIAKTEGLGMQRTDCALPILHAQEKKIGVDTFITITDDDTWCGRIHPCQALKSYRREFGVQSRNVVVGMTATSFSIADPLDPLTMDVVGFDTASPQLITDFSAGRI